MTTPKKPASPKPPVTDARKVPALSVQSKREGFRRAGRVWGKDVVIVSLSDLTKAEIKQLENEPELIVTEVEIEAPAEAE